MPKRKAKDLGEVEEPRRSTRRISTAKQEPPIRETSKKDSQLSKTKPKRGTKKANEKPAIINGSKDAEENESVRSFPFIIASDYSTFLPSARLPSSIFGSRHV